jgi:hypothetical protein
MIRGLMKAVGFVSSLDMTTEVCITGGVAAFGVPGAVGGALLGIAAGVVMGKVVGDTLADFFEPEQKTESSTSPRGADPRQVAGELGHAEVHGGR